MRSSGAVRRGSAGRIIKLTLYLMSPLSARRHSLRASAETCLKASRLPHSPGAPLRARAEPPPAGRSSPPAAAAPTELPKRKRRRRVGVLRERGRGRGREGERERERTRPHNNAGLCLAPAYRLRSSASSGCRGSGKMKEISSEVVKGRNLATQSQQFYF